LASAIQQELEKMGDYSAIDEPSLKMNTKKCVKELSEKYNDLEAVDKIYLA
jgi:hypothetical protein